MKKVLDYCRCHQSVIVWSLRVIVGATFIISGVSKLIDLWGFIYKIEQYFRVWGIPDLRSIIFMIALLLSALEFAAGVMLATGSFKRCSAFGLSALMLFMLPLSAYLWLANPVEDCGCFGDFITISNLATFLKNLALCMALALLCLWNKNVKGLYNPYVQWVQVVICLSYAAFVSLWGYNVQPMLDFRNYPVGTSLVVENDINDEVVTFEYEKNGDRETFGIDNLPDSTWTFVKRIETSEVDDYGNGFVIMEDDEDITADVITDNGEQLLLLIPEVDRADISYTYIINEINRYINDRGGNIIGLIATNRHGLEYWKDISMADYELYSVEDTDVKEMARGHISFVYLKDGVIQWKRTLSSIDEDLFAYEHSDLKSPFEELYIDGNKIFGAITLFHVMAFVLLFVIDTSRMILTRRLCRKNQKKELTLQN